MNTVTESVRELGKVDMGKLNEVVDVLYYSMLLKGSGLPDLEPVNVFEKKRVFLVGNGGSSSTASHLCSDLLNLGFDAVCLTDNVPRLTAVTNDYGWGHVYEHILKSYGSPIQSVLIIFSVNGSSGESGAGEAWSQNLYSLAKQARSCGASVVSIVGNNGGEIRNVSDICISVESRDAYVVEGCHSVLAHALCMLLRRREK